MPHFHLELLTKISTQIKTMLQQLFINFGEKLIELKELEPNGDVARVLDRVFSDKNLDDHLVEILWRNKDLRSLLKRSIDLPNDELIYKAFLKDFPYRTFLRNINDKNYLRIYFAQKANEFKLNLAQTPNIEPQATFPLPQTSISSTQQESIIYPQESSEVDNVSTSKTSLNLGMESDTSITNSTENSNFLKVTKTETEPFSIIETEETNTLPNLEFSMSVQAQESIMKNKRNNSTRRHKPRREATSQTPSFKRNMRSPINVGQTAAKTSNFSKIAIAASVGGLGAASSIPFVSIFFT